MNLIRKGKNVFVCSPFPHELTISKVGVRLKELTKGLRAKIELFDVWNSEANKNGLTEQQLIVMYDYSVSISNNIKSKYGSKSIHLNNG